MQKLFACGICVSQEFSVEVSVWATPALTGWLQLLRGDPPGWVGGPCPALPCPALPLALERRCARGVSPGEPALVSQACPPTLRRGPSLWTRGCRPPPVV